MGVDIEARQAKAAQIIGPACKVDIVIFQLGAPIAAHGKFDAGARGPAGLVLPRRCDGASAAIVDIDVAVPPGKAAGHIRHRRSECISNAAADGADVIERGVEWRRCQCRRVHRTGERGVGLDAEHHVVRKLLEIADVEAADQAGRGVREECRLLREGIGTGSQMAAAIADRASDVKPGPVINRFQNAWTLRRRQSRDRRT